MDSHRKQRQIARMKRLLDVAIEMKQVSAGVSLARTICQLEGWLPMPTKDEPQEQTPSPAPDMSRLIQVLDTRETAEKD